jgi:hypothetical protein
LSSAHVHARAFPFLDRLRQRCAGLSPELRRDTVWLIAQQELNLARQALQAGRRGQAWRWLIKARPAAGGRRWWFTLLMAALMPRRWIERSLRWRERVTAAQHQPGIALAPHHKQHTTPS